LAIVFFSLCYFSISTRGTVLNDPKEIIMQSREYALSLDSYRYIVEGDICGVDTAEKAKRMASMDFSAGGDNKKNNDDENASKNSVSNVKESVCMHFLMEYKFKKPYLLQMRIIKAENVPKMFYGSKITYRPDKDPDVLWLKPRISPITVKRNATGESGALFYSTMNVLYDQMEILNDNGQPILKGLKKVRGRDTYIIEWQFPEEKKIETSPINFEKTGVPKVARNKYTDEVNALFGQARKIIYYFDKDTMLIVAREVFDYDGKLFDKKEWRDIEVNNLSEKDF
jgi:hypothetical protein